MHIRCLVVDYWDVCSYSVPLVDFKGVAGFRASISGTYITRMMVYDVSPSVERCFNGLWLQTLNFAHEVFSCTVLL